MISVIGGILSTYFSSYLCGYLGFGDPKVTGVILRKNITVLRVQCSPFVYKGFTPVLRSFSEGGVYVHQDVTSAVKDVFFGVLRSNDAGFWGGGHQIKLKIISKFQIKSIQIYPTIHHIYNTY